MHENTKMQTQHKQNNRHKYAQQNSKTVRNNRTEHYNVEMRTGVKKTTQTETHKRQKQDKITARQ